MKVGQKYKVRSWDDMKREFGIAQTGDEIYIPCLAFFVKDMCRFLETNNKELNDEIKHYYWDEEMLTSAGLLAQIIQRRKTHV